MSGNYKKKKKFLASHKKSSAMLISLGFHSVLLVVAIFIVAVTAYEKPKQGFKAKITNRPKMKKKLPVPTKQHKKPKPRLQKRLLVKTPRSKIPNIVMPPISGVKSGIASGAGMTGGLGGLGFSMPEMNFIGTKAKGGKVCFLIHFGIATTTIGKVTNPYTRMTAYTIRNRLTDLIKNLPEDVLFNVACFWQLDAGAMSPKVLPATPANKQMVYDWMKHTNPLEGNYSHNFQSYRRNKRIQRAKNDWPTKVDGLSMPSVSWIYPYVVPKSKLARYCPDAAHNFQHWNRILAWAILTQKPDTIFLLTNNYVGDCYKQKSPMKMRDVFKKMLIDVYGEDKKNWPTFNVVVLTTVGRKDGQAFARHILKDMFGPLINLTKGDGSIIKNIADYMNPKEKEMYKKYKRQYAE